MLQDEKDTASSAKILSHISNDTNKEKKIGGASNRISVFGEEFSSLLRYKDKLFKS
jgi:hypothetical protein